VIIGMSGYARVGKDSFADVLVRDHGFVKLSFADPMREALTRLDPILRVGEGLTMHLSQCLSTMTWDELKAESPDIRPLMQRLGTEMGRNMFGKNFWVDLAMKEAEKHEHVVFADVRFANEAQAIKDRYGYIWRIHREGYGPANTHVSEVEMDGWFPDVRLSNVGSLEDLSTLVMAGLRRSVA